MTHSAPHRQVEGKVALRFASAYGFRSIQGIITKLKVSEHKHDLGLLSNALTIMPVAARHMPI